MHYFASLLLLLGICAVIGEAVKIEEVLRELHNHINQRSITQIRSKSNRLSSNESEISISPSKHHHHQHFPPPSFLKKVSPEARKEFYQIVKNRDISRNEMKQQLVDWAKKQKKEIETDLQNYFETLKKIISEWHKETSKLILELPKAYEKVHRILSDANLSSNDVQREIKALNFRPSLAHSLRYTMFFAAHPSMDSGDELSAAQGVFTVEGGYDFGKSIEQQTLSQSSMLEKKYKTAVDEV